MPCDLERRKIIKTCTIAPLALSTIVISEILKMLKKKQELPKFHRGTVLTEKQLNQLVAAIKELQ